MSTCMFNIICAFIGAIAIAVFLFNGIYFFRLKKNYQLTNLEINSMYWLSVVLLVLSVLFFGWSLFQAYSSCGIDKKYKEYNEYRKNQNNMQKQKEDMQYQ